MTDRYSRYEDAMITQARLLDWTASLRGARYLQHFFEDVNGKHDPEARIVPQVSALLQYQMLRDGDPIYASAEACELVQHAAETFQPEAVLPGDPFVSSGFALLGQPLYVMDATPTEQYPLRSPTGQIPVRALAWTPVHNEDYSSGYFVIAYYTDIDDEIMHAAEHGVANRWGNLAEEARHWGALTLMHQFQWQWGSVPNLATPTWHEDEDSVRMIELGRVQAALIQTFWRIASQFRSAPERAPRGIWRDANRKGVKGRDVTVIRLRRTRDDHEVEPAGRSLTVRFPVRGHWRNQWYPSLQAHRQTWIAPYIKGPDDAPFVMKQRAWEFTR